MNRETFWSLMDRFREESAGDEEQYLEIADRALNILEEKTAFRKYLGAYTNAANESIALDMACKVINGYVSDDTALYFTLWVISQGQKALVDALRDPETLAALPTIPFGNAEFEMLMSIGLSEEDYEEGFDEVDFDGFSPNTSAEYQEVLCEITYWKGDKFGGYESFEAVMEDIPNSLPKLIARAEREGFDWKHGLD